MAGCRLSVCCSLCVPREDERLEVTISLVWLYLFAYLTVFIPSFCNLLVLLVGCLSVRSSQCRSSRGSVARVLAGSSNGRARLDAESCWLASFILSRLFVVSSCDSGCVVWWLSAVGLLFAVCFARKRGARSVDLTLFDCICLLIWLLVNLFIASLCNLLVLLVGCLSVRSSQCRSSRGSVASVSAGSSNGCARLDAESCWLTSFILLRLFVVSSCDSGCVVWWLLAVGCRFAVCSVFRDKTSG